MTKVDTDAPFVNLFIYFSSTKICIQTAVLKHNAMWSQRNGNDIHILEEDKFASHDLLPHTMII
jgi:hypothetical protein